MKTTLHYSTFVTLNVSALGMTATIDMDCKPLNEVLDFVEHIFNNDTMFCGEYVQKVVVTDTNTGELIAECEPNKEINDDAESWPTPEEIFDDWDYNEDMGFDPYLGCYSDDC
jgi:hypothetical protein